MKTNIWDLYQQEKYGRRTLYIDADGNTIGFINYSIFDDRSCYVDTLFIKKEYRNKKYGQELEMLLIKIEKPSIIYCDVDLNSSNPESPLSQFLGKGYKVDKLYESRIGLKKCLS
jgi:hypothetical protein